MTDLPYRPMQYLMAWLVHIFTASAAFFGIWALVKIQQHAYTDALWLIGITIFIDAIDGFFARKCHVKTVLPNLDGALLDNIVDYLNYVIVPCVFLLSKPDMLPGSFALLIVFLISVTSAYQFCQLDAKTPDHFFKGFPCYWNIVLFYMFIFNTSAITNAILLLTLCVLVFVPIKYVYPSRLDYLTQSLRLKWLMHGCSILYGISSAIILWNYPTIDPIFLSISCGYIILYLALSLYRTYSPLIIAKMATHNRFSTHT